jgi:cysteinyl-tRNA synthetase
MWQRIANWLTGKRLDPVGSSPSPAIGRVHLPRPAPDLGRRRTAGDWPDAGQDLPILAPRLGRCRTWVYQLQGVNWERIEASISDVAVIDATVDGTEATAFSAGQVERMRTKPGSGGETLLLCYLSLGAAEPWRGYWRPKWETARPGWMDAAAGGWSGTHLVHYWDKRWQAMVIDQPGSLIDRIVAAGYGGVVLDGIDAYQHFRAKGRSSAPDDMIDLVGRIGAKAWQTNPDFLVVPINGEELLGSTRYRSTISAVLCEDLLFRGDGEGGVIETDVVAADLVMSDLKLALADGIPVLAVEYLLDTEGAEARISEATRQLRGMGLAPYFAPRQLDRLAPPPL